MRNMKVVGISLAALFCMYLTFFYDWIFILPAALLSWYGWKMLSEK